mmetsp:Transcript_6014/g.19639  ORF Transcript_6014/g.19639 Transcript_6014/m.19639 type:complete len:201 (+) Transcript_6014:602-1204(+)
MFVKTFLLAPFPPNGPPYPASPSCTSVPISSTVAFLPRGARFLPTRGVRSSCTTMTGLPTSASWTRNAPSLATAPSPCPAIRRMLVPCTRLEKPTEGYAPLWPWCLHPLHRVKAEEAHRVAKGDTSTVEEEETSLGNLLRHALHLQRVVGTVHRLGQVKHVDDNGVGLTLLHRVQHLRRKLGNGLGQLAGNVRLTLVRRR